jgi:hypothetical protein
MTTRHFIAALLATTFGAGAYAQEATSDAWMNVHSTTSREAVQQDLRQATIEGLIPGEAHKFVAMPSSQSRADVRASLNASKISGEFGVLQAEVYSFTPTQLPSRTMAMVGQ